MSHNKYFLENFVDDEIIENIRSEILDFSLSIKLFRCSKQFKILLKFKIILQVLHQGQDLVTREVIR